MSLGYSVGESPRRAGKTAFAKEVMAQPAKTVEVSHTAGFGVGSEVLVGDERYAVEAVDAKRSTLGLKPVVLERGNGKMQTNRLGLMAIMLAMFGAVNSSAYPSYADDVWGATTGSGRYGRPHSKRNKLGSHKQTMRKLGKLK